MACFMGAFTHHDSWCIQDKQLMGRCLAPFAFLLLKQSLFQVVAPCAHARLKPDLMEDCMATGSMQQGKQ
eukprot:1160023-Pelagomonas_calceolata.AAC.2